MNAEEVESNFSDMRFYSNGKVTEYAKENEDYTFDILIEDNMVSEINVSLNVVKTYESHTKENLFNGNAVK